MMSLFAARPLGGVAALTFLVLGLGATSTAYCQGSPSAPFVYQGQLKYLGGPFSGSADFQFTLWDAPTGGTQIGLQFQCNDVVVTASLFSTVLDFGTIAFNGAPRYLQVAARFSGGSTFTTLSPRQPLYTAPFALQTRGLTVSDDNSIEIGPDPSQPVATLTNNPSTMIVHTPLSLNNTLDQSPPVGTVIGTVIHQPADANFAPLKMRPAAYGQESPPQLDWNLYLSQPTDNGGTRQNRVMTFGYNNDPDGFPEVRDDATIVDRWESNWFINGHNYFERHIQYVSVNEGPHYLKQYRPLSIFIDKDDDTINSSLAQDSLSIESGDGATQYFRFAGTSLYCYGGSRLVFPDTGTKTCIYAIGSDNNFGDVLGVDSADVIHLGGDHMEGGVDIDYGDLNVMSGDAAISGALTVGNGAAVAGGLSVTSGNVTLGGLGNGLAVTEGGAAARMGVVRLLGGTATILTTAAAANARIFLTSQEDGNGPAGAMRVSARVPGLSFTISSSRTNDTASVAWFIVLPN